MKKIFLGILLAFTISGVAIAKAPATTVTATPNSIAVGETTTITWSNLPEDGDLSLGITSPCYISVQAVNVREAASFSFTPTFCPGEYTVLIDQVFARNGHLKQTTIASSTFEVNP
jgi:hypothetical protein